MSPKRKRPLLLTPSVSGRGIVPSVRQLPPSGRALMKFRSGSFTSSQTRTSTLAVRDDWASTPAPTETPTSATASPAMIQFFTRGMLGHGRGLVKRLAT